MGQRMQIVRAWEIVEFPFHKDDDKTYRASILAENGRFQAKMDDPEFAMSVEAAFCLLFPDQFLKTLEDNIEMFIPPKNQRRETIHDIVGAVAKASCEAMHPIVNPMKEVYHDAVLKHQWPFPVQANNDDIPSRDSPTIFVPGEDESVVVSDPYYCRINGQCLCYHSYPFSLKKENHSSFREIICDHNGCRKRTKKDRGRMVFRFLLNASYSIQDLLVEQMMR